MSAHFKAMGQAANAGGGDGDGNPTHHFHHVVKVGCGLWSVDKCGNCIAYCMDVSIRIACSTTYVYITRVLALFLCG